MLMTEIKVGYSRDTGCQCREMGWLICLHRSDISFGYVICTEPASRALGAVVLGQIYGKVKHTNMALRGQKLLHSSLVQSLILLCYTGQIMMLPLCLLTSKIGIITH